MKGSRRRVWLTIVADLLAIGVILCTFALFHHVIPKLKADAAMAQRPPAPVAATAPTPAPTPVPTPAPIAETEPPVEETPDLRTPWQIRFEEHFTPEVAVTDHSYTSPNVSIQLDTVVTEISGNPVTYYLADIYIAGIENFRTSTAGGGHQYMATADVLDLDNEANALIAISGDFLTYQASGFLMRNGDLYCSDQTYCDICVLYEDGSMETYAAHSYDIDEILQRGAVQVWNFGPELLDGDGRAKTEFNMSQAVSYINPRSALGYYEPGHYCFLVVDGRQPHSAGMTMPQLAQFFEELGCTAAYNLDGGGTAVMSFQHQVVSRQSNGGRKLGDILYICESEAAP